MNYCTVSATTLRLNIETSQGTTPIWCELVTLGSGHSVRAATELSISGLILRHGNRKSYRDPFPIPSHTVNLLAAMNKQKKGTNFSINLHLGAAAADVNNFIPTINMYTHLTQLV